MTTLDSESDALYSKENLEIKGDSTLDIIANGGYAINASDNLTIENGVNGAIPLNLPPKYPLKMRLSIVKLIADKLGISISVKSKLVRVQHLL